MTGFLLEQRRAGQCVGHARTCGNKLRQTRMALRVAGWSLLLWLLVLDAVATNADSIAEHHAK